MKKFVMLLMLLLIPTVVFAQGSIESQGNYIAKHWGGKANVTLPVNHKLVFEEDSGWGLMEGKIIIQEVENGTSN